MKCATPGCANERQGTAPFCQGCQPVFPSMLPDRAAFARARQELGDKASINTLLARAQEIKQTLQNKEVAK